MTVVDEYLASTDEPTKAALERVRKIIKEIAPDAVEAIVYGVPGFTYNKHFFIGFAAHNHFLSLYPASKAIETFKDQLAGYELTKGAIRFTLDNPIPDNLLKDIVSARFNDIVGK